MPPSEFKPTTSELRDNRARFKYLFELVVYEIGKK